MQQYSTGNKILIRRCVQQGWSITTRAIWLNEMKNQSGMHGITELHDLFHKVVISLYETVLHL